tara:strand:+ start:11001 stop:11201 length:201 start_codon:yes stop_codon:yes gene_type:complete
MSKKKYNAYVEVGYWVEFEDDGETDLNDQAMEAASDKHFSDWEELAVRNVEELHVRPESEAQDDTH